MNEIGLYQTYRESQDYLRNCPTCADGGWVTTYEAVEGLAVAYICMAATHPAPTTAERVFPRRDARV